MFVGGYGSGVCSKPLLFFGEEMDLQEKERVLELVRSLSLDMRLFCFMSSTK